MNHLNTFNPFDKDIHENLEQTDINTLIEKEVSEGYFVEYKQDFPSKEKIAKSIASFANTYGGWFIVGIKTNERHLPVEVLGYNSSSLPDAITFIRQMVTALITPTPLFIPQVIRLDTGRDVLAVFVPKGQHTPFICWNGVIYRRNHESSEPVSEMNRYSLDQLIERGKEYESQIKAFCVDTRGRCKGEMELPSLAVYLIPTPLGTCRCNDIMDGSFDVLRKYLSSTKECYNVTDFDGSSILKEISIPFDTALTSFNSIILRQANNNRNISHYNPLECEIFRNGCAKLLSYIPTTRSLGEARSGSYDTEDMRSTIDEASLPYIGFADSFRLIEMPILLSMLAWFIEFHNKIYDKCWYYNLEYRIEFNNMWRVIPFSDIPEWKKHVLEFGLPIINKSKISIPSEEQSTMSMSRDEQKKNYSIIFCGFVLKALGLPYDIFVKSLLKNSG